MVSSAASRRYRLLTLPHDGVWELRAHFGFDSDFDYAKMQPLCDEPALVRVDTAPLFIRDIVGTPTHPDFNQGARWNGLLVLTHTSGDRVLWAGSLPPWDMAVSSILGPMEYTPVPPGRRWPGVSDWVP